MVKLEQYAFLAQKETPFAGRKPEDAIFGGVPFLYIIYHIGLFVKDF